MRRLYEAPAGLLQGRTAEAPGLPNQIYNHHIRWSSQAGMHAIRKKKKKKRGREDYASDNPSPAALKHHHDEGITKEYLNDGGNAFHFNTDSFFFFFPRSHQKTKRGFCG